MEPSEIMSVATMSEFNNIMNSLNLTDRQKQIFDLKYHRGFRHIDIAEELQLHQDTICKEMKIITEKLKQFSIDKLNGK